MLGGFEMWSALSAIGLRRTALFSEVVKTHVGKVSDKWSGYLPIYDQLFAPLRHKPLTILEIGVQNGGSLECYARYFSSARSIVGCDIDERCRGLTYDSRKIRIVVGDACSPGAKAEICAISDQFDLIVDDGSHKSHDIVDAFLAYFPMLRPGGLYIVEDLSCSYWQLWEGGLFHPNSAIAFFKLLTDVVNAEHWGIGEGPRDLRRSQFTQLRHSISDDVCSQVYSVCFYNSLVAIQKSGPGHESKLGPRVVVGTQADVVPVPPGLNGSTLKLDQSNNPQSAFPPPRK